MGNKSVFKKGMAIGIILLFIGTSVVSSISGNVEEKNKTNIDINPTLNGYITIEPFINNNISNEKNERYRNTQPAIFNGGNSKGWSTTEVVSTESTNDSYRPSLMVDTDGVVHVTWQDHTEYGGAGHDWDIFYKYKNNGGDWSTTEVVSTESTEDSYRPSLMVDTDGVVHIAWMDYTDYDGSGSDIDIFYKYKNNGGDWSTTEVVSTESTEDSYRPSLMVDTDGVVHVAWQDHTEYGGAGHDWDIFYKYKNNGGDWSTTEVVSTESKLLSESPSLMVDTDGVVHVAWEDHTDYGGAGNDDDIFYKYKNNGGDWSTTEVVSTESTEYSWYSSLRVDSDGVVHVAWQDHTEYGGSDSDIDIFYKYKSGGNEPPNKPTINGPTSGKAGTSYDYTLTSTDLDGDQVSYYIKWDDESITDWTAFQDSGPPGYSESHVWHDQGTYTIEAKAKDIYGAESDWATLDVTMPKTKTINANLQWIFQRFLNAFPILRYFFGFGV